MCRMTDLQHASDSSLHELELPQKRAEIAPCMPAPHLQFGQMDKPHADVMIDESAKRHHT